jgi:hypothetical protein
MDIEPSLVPRNNEHVWETGCQEDGLNLRRSAKHWRASIPHRYELREPGDISAEEHRHVELPEIDAAKSAFCLWVEFRWYPRELANDSLGVHNPC